MADLDYAFLADFARVEPTGTLTAMSASWTHLWVPALPSVHRLSVAGRVRAGVDDGPIPMRIEIFLPSGDIVLGTDFAVEAGPDAKPYADNRIGLLFAIETIVPIIEEGKFRVSIRLDGEVARDLYFEAGQKAG